MAYLSRSERILLAKIAGTSYSDPAQSRLEELLLQLNTSGGIDTSELTRELLELKDKVGSLQNTAEYLEKAMSKNANDIGGLKTSVSGAQNKIIANQENINELGKGVEELNTNIRDIQEDVIEIEDHAIFDSTWTSRE